MNEQYFIKDYIIQFDDGGFNLKFKPKSVSKAKKITLIVLMALFPIAVLPFSIFCIIKSAYFYGVLFMLFSVIVAFSVVFHFLITEKRNAVFQFTVDSSGIKHIDANATYSIGWKDVVAFGFIDDIPIVFKEYSNKNHQICLYFAKQEYGERDLRRKFFAIPYYKTFMHGSTEKMIVLAFLQPKLDEEIMTKIVSCIYRYCDKGKERSFFTERG